MTKEEVKAILIQFESSNHSQLVNKVIRSGIRYARIRVDWYLLPLPERIELDKERTIAHNAFISSCDMLARNMKNYHEDVSWRKLIGEDRKEIGDFACWIHLIYGLRAS